jgi:hypothetical protein
MRAKNFAPHPEAWTAECEGQNRTRPAPERCVGSLRTDEKLAQLAPIANPLQQGQPFLRRRLAVARRWRLQHEVESMQRRAFWPSLKHAEQELALWIEGDSFLEQWSERVHTLLEWVQRASSAVENVNSIFKPLVDRKKHFDNADTNLNFVALFALWHNMRTFKEGKRAGYSPFEILGIDLGEKDWRTLLGHLPVL